MPSKTIRDVHAEGWEHLFALVKRRNDLLRQVHQPLAAALDLTPASGLVADVDTARLRQLLDQVDELTPRIEEAIEQHNAAARQIGKPEVHWQKLDLHD